MVRVMVNVRGIIRVIKVIMRVRDDYRLCFRQVNLIDIILLILLTFVIILSGSFDRKDKPLPCFLLVILCTSCVVIMACWIWYR